ncbi:hypothetical protein JZU69_02250, partial [bacterium]|nr:hypothetical protein [bacterium]
GKSPPRHSKEKVWNSWKLHRTKPRFQLGSFPGGQISVQLAEGACSELVASESTHSNGKTYEPIIVSEGM